PLPGRFPHRFRLRASGGRDGGGRVLEAVAGGGADDSGSAALDDRRSLRGQPGAAPLQRRRDRGKLIRFVLRQLLHGGSGLVRMVASAVALILEEAIRKPDV